MATVPTFPPFHGNVDASDGRYVIIVGTLLPALATIIVFTRLILRYTTKIGIGLDDISIFVALVMIWGITACIYFLWHNGMGLHVPETPILNLERYLRSLYAFELFYIADFGCCKVSILLFYQRVFSVTRERRNLVWGLMAFMVIFTVVFELVFVFQCSPLHFFWSRVMDPTSGTCMNSLILYGIYTGINIITDLMIWLYPLPIVWKLHVNTKQKIGLGLVFVGGALVCIISIVRATTIPKIVSPDFTYANLDAAVWAISECSLCCIVACLPTIRSLFIRRSKPSSTSPSSYNNKISNPKTSITSGGYSRSSQKKWHNGIETTVHITQDPDPEDGLPLTTSKDGWNRIQEGNNNSSPEVKSYGW